jgi:tetratricopeptide (TPR) repeat protein
MSIEDYFPEGESGLILVTTCNPSNKLHGTIGPRAYHFNRLDDDAAIDLLLKAASEPLPWSISTRNSASLITKALGYQPLAIIHAGGAIRNQLYELDNYLHFYKKSWERVRQARRSSGYHVHMDICITYEIIYQKLEEKGTEECRDAIDLLKLFSFLHCKNIRANFLILAATNPKLERLAAEDIKTQITKPMLSSKAWIESIKGLGLGILAALPNDQTQTILPRVLREYRASGYFDDLRLRSALKVLEQWAMIDYDYATESYSMHPLTHTWVREGPQMSTGEQAIWCEAASTMLAQCILLPPLGTAEADEDLRRDLLPHIIHMQRCQENISQRILENQKTRRTFPFPVSSPRFGRRQAVQWAKFSLVYVQCGLYHEAEILQIAVKEFVCGLLGTDHPTAINVLLFLSGTYWQQSRANEAAEIQKQVLQGCMKSLGPDHPKTLKVMDTLGTSRGYQGRYKEAVELHEKAIEGMTRVLGADCEDTLLAVDNLGRILSRNFRHEEAKNQHLKAVAGMKKVLGPTHLSTLFAMENLALTYLELGGAMLNPAHDLMVEVLAQRKKKLGKEQPYTLLAICNLARIKSALGQTDEAEALICTALPIAERNLGVNHTGTLAGRVHLAQILVRQKRYSEAEDILTDVIRRHRYPVAARDDGGHPDRIHAMFCLVECYQLQGKIEDAIGVCDDLYEGITELRWVGCGSDHVFAQRLQDKRAELQAEREAATM